MTGIIPSLEISIMRLVEAQARDSSSTMIAWVTWSAPWPPYPSGMPREGNSMATQALKLSHGYSAVSSTSAARGAILSSQNCRMTLRNSRCSSVRVIGCTVPVSRPPAVGDDVGAMPVRLLAENLPLDTGIPPWITLAFVALWVGIVVMAWLLWQRRRANRRALRDEQRRSPPARQTTQPD